MNLWTRLRTWLSPDKKLTDTEREMDIELRHYFDSYTEDLRRSGIPREEAQRRARLQLGGIETIKEECRDARGARVIETLWQDLRFGLRTLRKNPGFTAVTVLTLALGIGANTAAFSVVNAVLLHPLPYKAAQRLAWAAFYSTNGNNAFVATEDYQAWGRQKWLFEEIGNHTFAPFIVMGAGDAQRSLGAMVSPNFLHVLGVEPKIGRDFLANEATEGSPLVLLVTDEFWRSRLSSDPAVVGRTLNLNEKNYSIIGVLPASFEFPANNTQPSFLLTRVPGATLLNSDGVVARLRPGISTSVVATNLNALVHDGSFRSVTWNWVEKGGQVRVQSLHEHLTGDVHRMLLILMSAVGFVLLIACANVANLQLARAFAREREVAIRGALGANGWRLARQLLTESALLGVLGGTAGLLLASWLIALARKFGPSTIPHLTGAKLDLRVLLFTLLLSLAAGLVFGLAPVWASIRKSLNSPLQEGGARGGSSAHSRRTQQSLMTAEIALALVLFIGAGLLVRTLQNLTSLPLNFDPHNVVTARFSLPYTRPPEQWRSFFAQVSERVRALPGVTSVGAMSGSELPLRESLVLGSITIQGRIPDRSEAVPQAMFNYVTPGYFEALRIPLLAGRFLDGRDVIGSEPVVVVNQTFARRYFGNDNPIGKKIKHGADATGGTRMDWNTIVGVMADVKQQLAAETSPEMVASYNQWPNNGVTLVIRTAGNPDFLIPAIRDQITALDKGVPLDSVETMGQIVQEAVASQRFSALILSAFAALAVLLAAVGIYGVMAYAVGQRTREIGVRMALGAESSSVLRMVLGQGLRLALGGVAIGLLTSVGLTRVMSSMLYGVTPSDPLTFCLVTTVLVAVALAACYIPARRAMRLDPVTALRCE